MISSVLVQDEVFDLTTFVGDKSELGINNLVEKLCLRFGINLELLLAGRLDHQPISFKRDSKSKVRRDRIDTLVSLEHF